MLGLFAPGDSDRFCAIDHHGSGPLFGERGEGLDGQEGIDEAGGETRGRGGKAGGHSVMIIRKGQ